MSTSTPWGAAQTSKSLARGIMSYTTASHGGIHLSPTRNIVIPEYMRNSDGWYEEDCEWAIPASIFPETWVKHYGSEDILEIIKSTLLDYYPDFYEKVYNVKIKEGESSERDKANFIETNKHNYIVISAIGQDHGVEVVATIGGVRSFDDETEKHFLVGVEEYRNRSNFGFVINLAQHKEI